MKHVAATLALLTWLGAPVLAGTPKKTPPKKTTTPTKTTKPDPTTPPTPDAGSGSADAKDAGAAAADAKTPTVPATPAPPAPTPSPPDKSEKPDKPEPATSGGPDVDQLRQEYLALRDELFKSRARANTVASQLYSTRVSIKLTYTTGRYYNPTKVSIRLDGANVYDDATGAIAKDDGTRFDGYVAPGRHVITFRVEASGKDDDSFTSMTETQLVVKAVAGKDLVVAGRAHDTGDIAYNWKREEHGSYGLGIDTSVKTVAAPKDKK